MPNCTMHSMHIKSLNIVNNLIFTYKRQNYNDNKHSIWNLSRLNEINFIHDDNHAHLLQIEMLNKKQYTVNKYAN